MSVVELSRVLWLTCGRDWEYRILLKPTLLAPERWADVERLVFGTTSSERTTGTLGGSLKVGMAPPARFAAVKIEDPRRRDRVRRPVMHHIVLFGPGVVDQLPADWALQLVTATEALLDEVHELQVDGALDGRLAELSRSLSGIAVELNEDAGLVAVPRDMVIRVPPKKVMGPPVYLRRPAVLALVVAVLGALALILWVLR